MAQPLERAFRNGKEAAVQSGLEGAVGARATSALEVSVEIDAVRAVEPRASSRTGFWSVHCFLPVSGDSAETLADPDLELKSRRELADDRAQAEGARALQEATGPGSPCPLKRSRKVKPECFEELRAQSQVEAAQAAAPKEEKRAKKERKAAKETGDAKSARKREKKEKAVEKQVQTEEEARKEAEIKAKAAEEEKAREEKKAVEHAELVGHIESLFDSVQLKKEPGDEGDEPTARKLDFDGAASPRLLTRSRTGLSADASEVRGVLDRAHTQSDLGNTPHEVPKDDTAAKGHSRSRSRTRGPGKRLKARDSSSSRQSGSEQAKKRKKVRNTAQKVAHAKRMQFYRSLESA